MRIFVIPGTFDGDNLGDVAMLQVAMERLGALWPGAVFTVLMSRPAAFRTICPGARLISMRASRFWLRRDRGPWRWCLPHRVCYERQFTRAFANSNLVVVAGCGILADAFQGGDARVLHLLRAAQELGIPTAMLGQGIGPMDNRVLFEIAAQVLPRVNAIFVRDAGASVGWLRRLKVSEGRITVTGDDAVEPAWRQAPSLLGGDIGVNLRVAEYAAIDGGKIHTIRQVLVPMALELGARLVGIPITGKGRDADLGTLKRLVPEDGEIQRLGWTPGAVIARVSGCRVVVTGSYHAGVFALSQGIPVVAVAQSEYYANKFQGLADQFGGGCARVPAGEPGFAERLGEAVAQAWASAPMVRSGLLAAAERQIADGRKAYARLPGLVDPAGWKT